LALPPPLRRANQKKVKAFSMKTEIKTQVYAWQERLRALKNIPATLALLWDSGPVLVACTAGFRFAKALVPVAMLWVSKLIIETVVGASQGKTPTTGIWWLLAAAAGPAAYAQAQAFLSSWLGVLLLVGWAYALFFHLCNGIRHLVWDAGHGFDITTTYATGWAVVAASAGLTLIAVVAGIVQWQHG